MTIIRNDQIQAALIAKLKAESIVTAELSDSSEIREDQWQGQNFTYPNIRVRLVENVPLRSSDCDLSNILVGFQVHTEDASSQNCDRISGIINDALHDKPFSQNNLLISLRTTNLIPAIRSMARTWRSEVLMSGLVEG